MGLIVRKHKKKKSARQKTDENILGLVYAVVCLFLWLMAYVGHFLLAEREDVINNAYNARLDTFSARVERGSILSSDREVLARTETDEEGREVRIWLL